MRSGRLRTACGFFLPCTTGRDANILDKAFRSTGKPFGPALSGQSASVRRRADGYAVADLRYRRPRATQGDAPCRAAGMLALGTDGKPPLSHDKRRALSERPSLASDQSFSGVRRPEAPLFIGGAGSADRGIASFATIVPAY